MDYTLSNWTALCRYTESGWLDADNNAAENAFAASQLGERIGSTAEATVVAAPPPFISACWRRANATGTTRSSISATCSFACPPCFPTPARKNFSPYSPTTGVPLDFRIRTADGNFMRRVTPDAYRKQTICSTSWTGCDGICGASETATPANANLTICHSA